MGARDKTLLLRAVFTGGQVSTGIVVAEIHAEREQSPDDDRTTTSRQPSATAAAARLPPEGPSIFTMHLCNRV